MTAPPWPTTLSRNAWATTAAVFPRIGSANKYLLNMSMEVKQYVSPFRPAGKGPIKSMEFNSPIKPAVLMKVLVWVVGLTGNLFILQR